jgi:hypothetical protein
VLAGAQPIKDHVRVMITGPDNKTQYRIICVSLKMPNVPKESSRLTGGPLAAVEVEKADRAACRGY